MASARPDADVVPRLNRGHVRIDIPVAPEWTESGFTGERTGFYALREPHRSFLARTTQGSRMFAEATSVRPCGRSCRIRRSSETPCCTENFRSGIATTVPAVPLWGQGQSFMLDPLHWLTLLERDPAMGWDLKFVAHRLVFSYGIGVASLLATGAVFPAAVAASGRALCGTLHISVQPRCSVYRDVRAVDSGGLVPSGDRRHLGGSMESRDSVSRRH